MAPAPPSTQPAENDGLSDFWARTALRLYQGLGSLIYPFSGPLLRLRARRGKEDRARRAERYGYASFERPEGPLVWLHAASVGESLAIMPLIHRMDEFGIRVVLTTGTVTSAAIADKRLPANTIHQYVPLDVRRAVSRFLDHWKPDLVIFAESEIWPVTIRELARRNTPQVLVNARMSDRSNGRWSRRPALARAIFGTLSQVMAQSREDADRFRALGAPWVTVVGNLKSDAGVPAVDPTALRALRGRIGDRPVWGAISTHSGEEEAIARVHAALVKRLPGLLTVLVPRHPNRADEVCAMLDGRGVAYARRSTGGDIEPATAVYLGDTMGEIGLYLHLCQVVFMGKSLGRSEGAGGGQNPLEPLACGVAVVSGARVGNFRETYAALDHADAVTLVEDEKELAVAVLRLLADPKERREGVRRGQRAVQEMGGALERSIEALDPYLLPLRVKASLERRERAARAAAGG